MKHVCMNVLTRVQVISWSLLVVFYPVTSWDKHGKQGLRWSCPIPRDHAGNEDKSIWARDSLVDRWKPSFHATDLIHIYIKMKAKERNAQFTPIIKFGIFPFVQGSNSFYQQSFNILWWCRRNVFVSHPIPFERWTM